MLSTSSDVRYVALYDGDRLETATRPSENASAAESDTYEELLVNPAIMLLAQQRGKIDCGGASYVIICYGAFYQLVMPWRAGHASIAIELTADPIALQPALASALEDCTTHG